MAEMTKELLSASMTSICGSISYAPVNICEFAKNYP